LIRLIVVKVWLLMLMKLIIVKLIVIVRLWLTVRNSNRRD